MKRFQAMAQRITAFVLSAGMMASAAAPTVLAAQQAPSAPLGAENSVDELGNVDVSDETSHVPDDMDLAADAADHTWGEWLEGEYEDGSTVRFRICEDGDAVQFEDGNIMIPEGGSADRTLDDSVTSDQPEWLGQGMLMGTDAYVIQTAADRAKVDQKWNYEADHSKWTIDRSTTYYHGYDGMGNNHGKYGLNVWTSESTHREQAVTCEKSGYIGHKCALYTTILGRKVTLCDQEWQETIPAPGQHLHNLYEAKATCTTDGVKYYYCGRDNGAGSDRNKGNGSICYYVWEDETVVTKAVGHLSSTGEYWFPNDEATKEKGWQTRAATCGEAGKRYRDCVNCDAADGYEEDPSYAENHPATSHNTDGVKWTKGDGSEVGWAVNQPYSCADGTKTRECDVCHKKETVTIPATEAHQLTDWEVTVEPTCTTTGTRVKKCTVCGNVVETETINALGHDFQNYVDDNRPACCDQYETGTCTRCDAKDTRKTSDPIRAHKFTHYEFGTFDGRLATRADCDYEGCTAYDDKAFSMDNYKENGCVLAATEASETIADYAEEVIKQAMRDAETAVANASTREEAIASLDVIVASVRSQLLNKKVSGEVRIDPGWGAWAIVKIPYSVTITEKMVGSMLTDLQNGMNSVKEMLGSSFLSKDAIQTLIGKVADTVAKSDDINYSMRWIAYPEVYYQITAALNDGNGNYPGGDSDKAGEKATISNLILQLAGDLVQKDPSSDVDAVQEFVSAIFDDLVDMLIEELKKDETYSKYLNNALGDQLLAELRPKLREELVNDTAFVDAVRGVVQNALSNAAAGVNKGWKEKAILAQFRSDLLKVQDPVEQEMIKLSGIIGDLVESSLAQKINKLLPFGDLTSWIGKWVGEFAKDKAVSAVVGETGMVHDTIELYIKYITCPGHDYHYITTRATTCTEDGEEKLKCSKCGWVRSDNKITHEKLGHVPVVDEAADPTETEEGLTEGSHCARCGAVLEAQEVIPALQPQMDAQLVCSAIPEEAVTAMRYENRKKLDAAMDAALTKAGYTAADSQRFLAQVNSSIGILPNDRYPEEGFTGYVPRPAQTAADKKYTWYAVQLLTVDAHGCNAGDVIITPVAQTDKGLQLTVYAQAVVALAWKEVR